MVQKESCHSCKQKNDCRQVYREIGHVDDPPVTAKVVLAFLLPLLVFTVSLGVFERLLTGAINEGRILTAASFLLALLVTFACVVMIKVLRR